MSVQEFATRSSATRDVRDELQTLQDCFDRYFLLADRGVIAVVMASVVANRLPGDPFWLFLVGPPSGFKTEPIVSLSGLDCVYALSDLTAQTFASGMKGDEDQSLLPRLKAGTVLTLKDFTTVLTMHRDRRGEILSQLREIYDGSYKKVWGTGKVLDWKGKVGLLAGVTGVVDTHYSVNQALGERFVQYRTLQPDRVSVARTAIANQGIESRMREELAEAVKVFFRSLNLSANPPELTADEVNRLASLSSLCATARSVVMREQNWNKEIADVPDEEAPPRLAKQLALFTRAAMVCGVADAYALTRKIAFDSIHKTRFLVICALAGQDDYVETSGVAMLTRVPKNTVRRHLEDLFALNLLEVRRSGNGESDRWKLSEPTFQLLRDSNSLDYCRGVPQVSEGI